MGGLRSWCCTGYYKINIKKYHTIIHLVWLLIWMVGPTGRAIITPFFGCGIMCFKSIQKQSLNTVTHGSLPSFFIRLPLVVIWGTHRATAHDKKQTGRPSSQAHVLLFVVLLLLPLWTGFIGALTVSFLYTKLQLKFVSSHVVVFLFIFIRARFCLFYESSIFSWKSLGWIESEEDLLQDPI